MLGSRTTKPIFLKKLKSILLVDDDETTNFLNKFFIRQVDAGLPVYIAENGKEAISQLKQWNQEEDFPCLLILDTNMPVMNGWEFLNAFAEQFDDAFREQITIVMLTALDTEENRKLALACPDVTDTVQKPLSDLKFRVLINKFFS